MLEEIVKKINSKKKFNKEVGYTYLSTLLGRTYEETASAAKVFEKTNKVNSLFNIVYWLGHHSIIEKLENKDREISFSGTLREKLGMHIFGEAWAKKIKRQLEEQGLLDKPLHIISSNLHSVLNTFFAKPALGNKKKSLSLEKIIQKISNSKDKTLMSKVIELGLKNGMTQIFDDSGTNIGVQIFDTSKIPASYLSKSLKPLHSKNKDCVLIVMDYAFGEQAYECMDELLKPYEVADKKMKLNVCSINIMGKAGILHGNKGDIMIPTAHVFEGSADNYPFVNNLKAKDFEQSKLVTYVGPMITVLGTSLQNKDILRYFLKSSWKAIGLEMEGAHYQKAIQAAATIRNSIRKNVQLRYAYYASDNPLESGSTLASGGLGIDGVKPTYEITTAILKGIFKQKN